MSFLALCPACHRETLAPEDDLGRAVRCHGCHTEFVLVPELSATTVAAWTPTPVARSQHPEPDATPLEAEGETEPGVTARDEPGGRRDPAPLTDTVPSGGGISWLFAGGACLAAVCAGLSASVTGLTFLLIPLAVVGLVFGGVALAGLLGGGGTPLELAVPGVPTAGCLLLLLVALLAPDYLSPQYEASRQKSGEDANAVRPVPLGGELIPLDQLGSADAGVDAGRFALQRAGIRVRVLAVTLGPVPLETKKPSATKERYLAVDLAFQHLGHGGPVTLRPWGGTGANATPAPRLSAAGQTRSPVETVPAGVKGVLTGEVSLPPGGGTTARLLFPDGPASGPLVLELPAEAWGQSGPFRFRIPPESVRTVPVPKGK